MPAVHNQHPPLPLENGTFASGNHFYPPPSPVLDHTQSSGSVPSSQVTLQGAAADSVSMDQTYPLTTTEGFMSPAGGSSHSVAYLEGSITPFDEMAEGEVPGDYCEDFFAYNTPFDMIWGTTEREAIGDSSGGLATDNCVSNAPRFPQNLVGLPSHLSLPNHAQVDPVHNVSTHQLQVPPHASTLTGSSIAPAMGGSFDTHDGLQGLLDILEPLSPPDGSFHTTDLFNDTHDGLKSFLDGVAPMSPAGGSFHTTQDLDPLNGSNTNIVPTFDTRDGSQGFLNALNAHIDGACAEKHSETPMDSSEGHATHNAQGGSDGIPNHTTHKHKRPAPNEGLDVLDISSQLKRPRQEPQCQGSMGGDRLGTPTLEDEEYLK